MKKTFLLAALLVAGCGAETLPDGETYHESVPDNCFQGMDDVLREYATSLSLVEKSRRDCEVEFGTAAKTTGAGPESRRVQVKRDLNKGKLKKTQRELAQRRYRSLVDAAGAVEKHPLAGPDEGASWVADRSGGKITSGEAVFRDGNLVVEIRVTGWDRDEKGRPVLEQPGVPAEELAVKLIKTQV